LLAVLVVGTAGLTSAQSQPQALNLYAGAAAYPNPAYTQGTLVEFVFSLNRNELSFYRPDAEDPNLYARIFAQVDIYDSTGHVIDSVMTYFSVASQNRNQADMKDVRVFNKLALFLESGVFSARVTAIDAVSKAKSEVFFDRLNVPSNRTSGLNISDVCFTYESRRVKDTAAVANLRLVRNGYYLIPNPNRVYTEEDTVVSFYAEIYGLVDSTNDSQTFRTAYSILDSDGQLFRSLGETKARKQRTIATAAHSFDIVGWPVDDYELRIVVTDEADAAADTVIAPFKIISRTELMRAIAAAQAFDPYDTISFQVRCNLVEYILEPNEKLAFSSLDSTGKENFLNQYWREHDINPSTEMIENRNEQIRRYEFANLYFSNVDADQDGWRTDRGRVYIIYGPWDERDEISSPRVGNAFEIWYYRQVKEGKHFVFEDWTGTSDYRLVHSNVYGEVYNQEWEDKVNAELLELY
jgi:GWxTD domain-containing protein